MLSGLAVSVLKLLGRGNLVSGSEIAAHLSVSRGAIWEAIEQIRSIGVAVHAVPGKGYRLEPNIELLDEQQIASLSELPSPQRPALKIEPFIDSTNAWASRSRPAQLSNPEFFLAEMQLVGRGRRGRSWISPFGRNVYCSALWRSDEGTATLGGLSLAAGVAAATALSGLGVDEIRLKWPNDLVIEGRKVGGILIEVGGEVHGPCYCVLGVGLNFGMQPVADSLIDQPWADIKAFAPELSRNRLAARLIDALTAALLEFEEKGIRPFLARWRSLDAFGDAAVRVSRADGSWEEGVARGIAENGALLLESGGKVTAYFSGEVSMRPVRGCVGDC